MAEPAIHLEPLRLAAMDLGTNSFHLVVADVQENGRFTVLGREKEMVRLGEGVSDMKHLSGEAIERALAVLRRFTLIAENHGAKIRAVATSAIREAVNREEFTRIVHEQVGIEVEVVSGFEEARLIYLGALQALPIYHSRAIVVDIGGGSTEFLLGEAGAVRYANSLKLGAVRLTRRFFRSAALRPADVSACRAWLRGELHPIRRALRGSAPDIAVGCSGTILGVAAMARAAAGAAIPLDAGGIVLSRKDVARVVERVLAASTVAKRRAVPGLDPARADIIVAGALLLDAIFEALDLEQMTTSRYALREGMLLDTIRKLAGSEQADAHLRDIRRSSVLHLGETCRYEAGHARTVARLALDLFDGTRGHHALGGDARELLEAAALLHDIGYHIAHSQHHLHAQYIIAHSELLGFTEREKEIVSNVARYHRKSHPKDKHEAFARLGEGDRELVRTLSAILRVADGLDRRHKSMFRGISCESHGKKMRLLLHRTQHGDVSLELWGAERRKELFEDVFDCRISFEIVESVH